MQTGLKDCIAIIEGLAGISSSLTSSEQLKATKELFYNNYNGSNPLDPEKGDKNVLRQLDIAVKGFCAETFKVVRYRQSELNLARVGYFGYSKEILTSVLSKIIMNIEVSKESKLDYTDTFAKIADEQDVGIEKSLILSMLILYQYDAYDAAGAIAFYLYAVTQISGVK